MTGGYLAKASREQSSTRKLREAEMALRTVGKTQASSRRQYLLGKRAVRLGGSYFGPPLDAGDPCAESAPRKARCWRAASRPVRDRGPAGKGRWRVSICLRSLCEGAKERRTSTRSRWSECSFRRVAATAGLRTTRSKVSNRCPSGSCSARHSLRLQSHPLLD